MITGKIWTANRITVQFLDYEEAMPDFPFNHVGVNPKELKTIFPESQNKFITRAVSYENNATVLNYAYSKLYPAQLLKLDQNAAIWYNCGKVKEFMHLLPIEIPPFLHNCDISKAVFNITHMKVLELSELHLHFTNQVTPKALFKAFTCFISKDKVMFSKVTVDLGIIHFYFRPNHSGSLMMLDKNLATRDFVFDSMEVAHQIVLRPLQPQKYEKFKHRLQESIIYPKLPATSAYLDYSSCTVVGSTSTGFFKFSVNWNTELVHIAMLNKEKEEEFDLAYTWESKNEKMYTYALQGKWTNVVIETQ